MGVSKVTVVAVATVLATVGCETSYDAVGACDVPDACNNA